MATVLYVNPAALLPGAALAAYSADPSKIRFDLGAADHAENRNGGGLGVQYTRSYLQIHHSPAVVVITTDAVSVDDTQVNHWPQFNKNSLADLVQKGLVVVERPAGAPVTAATIRAW